MMHTKIAIVATAFAIAVGCGSEAEPEQQTEPKQNAGQDAQKSIDDAKRQVEEQVDKAVDDVKEKAEEISAEAQAQFQGYLDSLGGLTTQLEGIKGLGDIGKAPAVKNVVDQVKASIEQLGGLDSETLDKLTEQFKPQLDAAVSAVRAQIDRIAANPSLKPVADVLRNLELIE